MATFTYKFDDWLTECTNRKLSVEYCKCGEPCDEPAGCINGRSKAIDSEGKIVSIFKHFINYGVFYD